MKNKAVQLRPVENCTKQMLITSWNFCFFSFSVLKYKCLYSMSDSSLLRKVAMNSLPPSFLWSLNWHAKLEMKWCENDAHKELDLKKCHCSYLFQSLIFGNIVDSFHFWTSEKGIILTDWCLHWINVKFKAIDIQNMQIGLCHRLKWWKKIEWTCGCWIYYTR